MNASKFILLAGLFSAAVFELHAEQTQVNRKQVEEVKAKAEAGDADSEYGLGLFYATGQGVTKDYAEAVKWFRKAAEQNVAKAQRGLGDCYFTGQGVAKNEVEGYKWCLLAAGQGDEPAKKNMALAESRLTRKQIAEAQRLARDFKPREAAGD